MTDRPADAPELHIITASPAPPFGDVVGMLVTRDGEPLWEHMSSNVGWLRRDLLTEFSGRAAQLRARYGDDTDRHVREAALHADQPPQWLIDAHAAWVAEHDEVTT